MLNKLRNISFWTLDLFKGKEIKKNLKQIEKLYLTSYDSRELNSYRGHALNILLTEAINYTDYYKDYDDLSLMSFPVINKKEVLKNQDEFLSTKYDKNNLIQMSTSGSTGVPFTSYQNIEKKKRVNAEAIFFNGLAGYNVGDKLIHLRSLNLKNKKSHFKQLIYNEKLIDIDKLDENNLENLVAKITSNSRNNLSVLLSYASTYDALALYIKHNEVKIKAEVEGIISTSEILHDYTREVMMDYFNCNMFSRYANMENGILGQDAPEHPNTFILNEANYIFEIISFDSDEPVEMGELGRIVLTDLYNYAMPMIRYDTGDIGTFKIINKNGVEKLAITNFGGRQIDMIYDYNGNFVSPHKISVSFWGYNEIDEFQFIQTNKKEYKVLLKLKNGKFTEIAKLKNTLEDILGKKSNIEFSVVNEIPKLKSGKKKYIMNIMK